MISKLIETLQSQTPLQTYQALKLVATEIPLFLPPYQENLIPAAVLVPIVMHKKRPTLLLTVRTSHLHHHGGQISFPGGKCMANETSESCALRETQEEIGLAAKNIEVISSLGSWPSYSGFLITPIIGIIQPPLSHVACEHEVEEIFEIPLEMALNTTLYQRVDMNTPFPHHYFELYFEQKRIWGYTAGLMLLLASFAKR